MMYILWFSLSNCEKILPYKTERSCVRSSHRPHQNTPKDLIFIGFWKSELLFCLFSHDISRWNPYNLEATFQNERSYNAL